MIRKDEDTITAARLRAAHVAANDALRFCETARILLNRQSIVLGKTILTRKSAAQLRALLSNAEMRSQHARDFARSS